jgi:macrolide-specific efflux system membrane fusion protein
MNAGQNESATPNRRRHRSRWPVIVALLVLAAAGGSYGWYRYQASKAAESEYLYATVTTGSIEDLVTSTGTLQPRDYVDVGAQVSGQIQTIHVEVGDVVQEGQKLVEIDATSASARVEANQAQMESAKTNLLTAQANLEKNKRDYERQENLLKEDATTKEAVLNAKTTYENSLRSVETSKLSIQQNEANQRIEANNLKYTTIIAPISGTVMSIAVKKGQTINASQSAPNVMRIASLGTMTVQSDVSEADIAKLYKEIPVYFTTLGGQNRRWYSKLKRVEPTPKTSNGVVLYNALFDIENEGALMPSMTAQVYFVNAEARDVLVVPMAAIQQGQQISRELAAKEQQAGKKPGAAVPTGAAGAAPAAAAPGGANRGGPPAFNGTPPSAEQMEQMRGRMRERGGFAGGAGGRGGPGGNFGPPGGQALAGTGGARPAQRRNGIVMVKKADGTLEERRVVIGVNDRVRGEVLEGLKDGEEVVVGKREKEAAAASGQNQQNRNNLPGGLPGGGPPGGGPPGGGFPGGGGGGRPF